MNREDWPILAVIFEAVDVLAGLGYCGLQVYYGVTYHISPYKIGINILVVLMIYAGLTLLALAPENLNRLQPQVCKGKIRRLSLRLIRVEKFLFLIGLMVPCICDVAAIHVPPLYNVAVIAVIVLVAVYYEVRILEELKKQQGK